MKRILVCLLALLLAIGFNWSLPLSSRPVPKQTAIKDTVVSYVTSVETLNYQGKKTQNRARLVSLAKIDRKKSSSGTTYALSSEAGFWVGNDENPAFYKASPVMVSRNSSNGLLTSDKKSLDPLFAVVNRTLKNLTHKRMLLEEWKESISLSLGEGFPETFQAQFWARPLPEPDSKWIAISVDSGLFSFRALEKKFQDSLIFGRYRGVLVYSPAEDAFLQSAATFTLYHNEDQFRIDQKQFAAATNGKQLHPVLDVGAYLDFMPETSTITAPGSFPTWCSQAAIIFDVLHLAIMTAAEGSTNPSYVATCEQALLDCINHDYNALEKFAGKTVADQFLGDWMKVINLSQNWHKEGSIKALFELSKEISKDVILAALPLGLGNMYAIYELTKDARQAFEEQMQHDSELLKPFPSSAPKPDLTTPKSVTPVPDSMEKEETNSKPKKKMSKMLLPAIVMGVTMAAALAVTFLKKDSSDSSDSCLKMDIENHCTQDVTSFKVNGTEYGPINNGATKNICINKNGSCTTVNWSYTTSRNWKGSYTSRWKSRGGVNFSTNISSNDDPIVGVSLDDC